MLRGAASRDGPLALRLREGTRYFQEGAHLKRRGGGSVNDTTPGHNYGVMRQVFDISCLLSTNSSKCTAKRLTQL